MIDVIELCVDELSPEVMAETSGGNIHLFLPAVTIASFFAGLFS